MKIKLDENLPARLIAPLRELGHDVDTIPEEGLRGQDDKRVWGAAQHAGRFFITQDLDFSDIRRFAPGTHHGILLVRLAKPGRSALTRHVARAFRSERADNWQGCFVVLTEHKVRVIAPRQP